MYFMYLFILFIIHYLRNLSIWYITIDIINLLMLSKWETIVFYKFIIQNYHSLVCYYYGITLVNKLYYLL